METALHFGPIELRVLKLAFPDGMECSDLWIHDRALGGQSPIDSDGAFHVIQMCVNCVAQLKLYIHEARRVHKH